ncbi:hypothetical protein QFZ67_004641 [Streptomyces sp. V1I1]|nr:hypothetical protein [Streptomyces sp. V1I1]
MDVGRGPGQGSRPAPNAASRTSGAAPGPPKTPWTRRPALTRDRVPRGDRRRPAPRFAGGAAVPAHNSFLALGFSPYLRRGDPHGAPLCPSAASGRGWCRRSIVLDTSFLGASALPQLPLGGTPIPFDTSAPLRLTRQAVGAEPRGGARPRTPDALRACPQSPPRLRPDGPPSGLEFPPVRLDLPADEAKTAPPAIEARGPGRSPGSVLPAGLVALARPPHPRPAPRRMHRVHADDPEPGNDQARQVGIDHGDR